MYNQDYYPQDWNGGEQPTPPPKKRGLSTGVWICLLCLCTVFSILLTFTLTSALNRSYYSQRLEEQQLIIDRLSGGLGGDADIDLETLALLDSLFERHSYYRGQKSSEELMTEVLKAYVIATGDRYAEYYTVEEFESYFQQTTVGESEGIGVNIVQTTMEYSGISIQVFQVIAVFKDSPAQAAGLRVGDCIYRVKADGVFQSVDTLGFTAAANAVRGPTGTIAELSVYRAEGDAYVSLDFSIVRGSYESQSVSYAVAETDATVGIVHISGFDLTTPKQFKDAVNALKASGVSHFIFDVRNNPGGDLQSIKAVLTYFLQEGDLILSAIDRDGKVVASYCAEPMTLTGEYSACNVKRSEIGMYADLDMVVLCNENTASAAEVFTATLRDYNLARIVGSKTFGKGIMQSTYTLSDGNTLIGYVKLTTHAYVTKCGITYHEIGIEPSEGLAVELSDEAKTYNPYLLPQAIDNQLQTAITAVKS